MKAYVAGALFSPAERAVLEQIAALCEQLGFTTYLPHRDGGVLRQDRGNSRQVFEQDRDALRKAEIVVAVLGGPDVDSGTAWEIGYATCANKPVVAICEDFRIGTAMELNPMIAGSAKITMDRSQLRESLRALLPK